jgi:hypothetical protein
VWQKELTTARAQGPGRKKKKNTKKKKRFSG